MRTAPQFTGEASADDDESSECARLTFRKRRTHARSIFPINAYCCAGEDDLIALRNAEKNSQIKAEPLDNNDMIRSSRCAAHVEQLADAVRDFVCS